MSTAAAAVATKKLRVYWDAAPLASAPPREALLEGVWAALRAQHGPPGSSQDERVEVRSVTEGPSPDTFTVAFGYVFDRDFASQYDETERYDGAVLLDRAGALVSIASWAQA